MFDNRKKAIFTLILTTLIWGSTYSIAKIGLQNIEPFTLGLIRGILATIILCIFCIINGLLKEILFFIKKHFFLALILGVLGMFFIQSFQNFGLKYSSSIMGGILINTSPIFVLLLSVLFLKEHANYNKIIGIIVGFIGIIMITIIGEDFSKFNTQNTFLGNIMLLGVSISWATYIVMAKKILREFHPLTLTFISYAMGTLFFIPTVLFTEDIALVSTYDLQSWLIILYLGILGSGVAYLLWNYGLKYLEASKASVYSYLSPVLALLFGFLLLHEKISIFDALGAILIFGGVYISQQTPIP